jgi:hypothetical protein
MNTASIAERMKMKIDSKDFRVNEGDEVNLKKWQTAVDPVYESKEHYRHRWHQPHGQSSSDHRRHAVYQARSCSADDSAGHSRTGEALMAADSKAYLGSGWAFPVRPSSGALRYVRHEEDIEQAIQIILLTGQGERSMLPTFGAGPARFRLRA